MSDGYSYILELVDRVSAPAKSAVDWFKKLAGANTAEAQAAKAATAGIDAAAKAHANAAKPIKDAADKTFDASNAMNVGKETISSALGSIAGAFKSLASGDVKGAVTGVADAVGDMAKLLDLAVPGLGQAVSSVIKIAGGFAGITAGLIQSGAALALESAGAKTAMLNMFDAMGGGKVKGEEVEGMIDNLKAKTGVLKDELAGFTKTMMAMGETDLGNLESSIHAMASAQAIMGQEGVSAFTALKSKLTEAANAGDKFKLGEKQLAKLYKTGVNVDDIAKKMGTSADKLRKELAAGGVDAKKFGDAIESSLIDKGKGPLDTMTAQLPYLKKMFSESIGDMFEDIDVAPFLGAVKDLFKVFSQASPAGQAMKAGIGGFFKEVFATATALVPVVKSFFLDMVIWALKAYIAAKPIVKTIIEIATSAKTAEYVNVVLSQLWTVLQVIGVVIAVVVVAFVALWAAMVAVSIIVWTIVGAFLNVGIAIASTLAGWVSSAASTASNFVMGLVQGITNGGASVVSAVTGLADQAKGAFKSALGIKSPSTVMAELGGYTTEGFQQGVEDGTASTQNALEAAVAPPAAPKGGGAGAGGGGGGPMIVIENLVIQAGSGETAQALAELLPARLVEALEELLMQKGGATA